MVGGQELSDEEGVAELETLAHLAGGSSEGARGKTLLAELLPHTTLVRVTLW